MVKKAAPVKYWRRSEEDVCILGSEAQEMNFERECAIDRVWLGEPVSNRQANIEKA